MNITELEVNKHCIFRAALMKWGVVAQLDMLIEEAYYRKLARLEKRLGM